MLEIGTFQLIKEHSIRNWILLPSKGGNEDIKTRTALIHQQLAPLYLSKASVNQL